MVDRPHYKMGVREAVSLYRAASRAFNHAVRIHNMRKLKVAIATRPDGTTTWLGIGDSQELVSVVAAYTQELHALGRPAEFITVRNPTEAELEQVAVEEAERESMHAVKN